MSAFNNSRRHAGGIQVGALNCSHSMTGVQLGLINIIRIGRWPMILPIITIGFGDGEDE